MHTKTLKLRSSLSQDRDTLKNVALSPDIVSLQSKTVEPEFLISSYDRYINLALRPNADNHVYLRAIASNPKEENFKTAFTLRAVPSGLILWPQVWNKQPIVGPGPIIIDADKDNQVVASSVPFVFRPSNLGGLSYAFVVSQDRITDHHLTSHLRLRETLAPLPGPIGNWREYFDFLKTDTRFTYSNVIIVDPIVPIVSVSTRIRLFEDDPSVDTIKVIFGVTYSGFSPGAKISFSSDDGSFNSSPIIMSQTGSVGLFKSLKPNFDGIVTMNLFLKPGDATNLSRISLQISTSRPEDKNTGVEGNLPRLKNYLLGVQNIVFDPAAATTNSAQFTGPTELQLNKFYSAGEDRWFHAQLDAGDS